MMLYLLATLAAAGAAGAGGYFIQRYRREREDYERLRALFSRYVPEQVVDDIVAHADPRRLWAQRHYATVLHCRIRNFGFFAEELSAEDTLRHLNEFYAVAGRAIVRHGGVIERLHADGITAVFGVLTAQPFQEERALRAALRIVRLANAMNRRWQAEGRRPFDVFAGVNSGDVVAGEAGFAQRREFAVVGNPAHVATLLAHAAEELHASIVASASTFEVVSDQFTGVPVTTLPLRGLRKLQKAYIVRGPAGGASEESLQLPATIPVLETVVDEPAPTFLAPQMPSFSRVDDLQPALPQMPAIAGDYEEPHSWR